MEEKCPSTPSDNELLCSKHCYTYCDLNTYVIWFKVQWDSGGHSNLPIGGTEDTVAIIWPHPQTSFPGTTGNCKWNWSYPSRDCYTRAAAGPTVRVS